MENFTLENLIQSFEKMVHPLDSVPHMSYVASYLCIAAVSLHLVSMAFSIFKCKGVIRLMFVVKGDDIVIFMIFYGYFAKHLSHHYYFIDL